MLACEYPRAVGMVDTCKVTVNLLLILDNQGGVNAALIISRNSIISPGFMPLFPSQ